MPIHQALFAKGGIVTSGLTLHLDAGISSSYSGSGTTWTDLSGNGYDGTLTNGAGYTTNDGGAITFDGGNDYVDVSGTAGLNAPRSRDFTFSVWFYLVNHSGYQGIFVKNRSDIRHVGLFLNPDKTVGWGYGDGSSFQGFDSTSTFSNGIWHNVTCVQTADSSRKMYINGVLHITNTQSQSGSSTGTETWRVGQATGTNEYLAGRVSQVLIYDNKVLTAAEVLQNYNTLKARHGL